MEECLREKIACNVCGGKYDKTHVWMHIHTKRHQKAIIEAEKNNIQVERIGIKTKDKVDMKTCRICEVEYVSEKYNSHCKTKKHQFAEKLLKKSI
jgi:hypothetical protein